MKEDSPQAQEHPLDYKTARRMVNAIAKLRKSGFLTKAIYNASNKALAGLKGTINQNIGKYLWEGIKRSDDQKYLVKIAEKLEEKFSHKEFKSFSKKFGRAFKQELNISEKGQRRRNADQGKSQRSNRKSFRSLSSSTGWRLRKVSFYYLLSD